ncbi:glycosyltransferase family 4 protein [Rhodococcus fascians]|nr:glycosyltransferase family 4 protein [Rhodococcus fascians]MBY4113881.1 glycosyltransferase family 4 protein [Rhodococcus fascians]
MVGAAGLGKLDVSVNTMPLLGKSEGVRRYIEELMREFSRMDSLTARPLGVENVRSRTTRMLTVPKLGFPVRQLSEAVVSPVLRMKSTDVFHYTDTYGPLYGGKVPTVITVHDTTFITHRESHDAWVANWLGFMCRRTWGNAKQIIAVSDVTARDIINLGVDPDKVTVVHHGIDHTSHNEGEQIDRLKNVPYFAYLGNIEPRKGLPVLIEAFKTALPFLPSDCVLAIAGKNAWGDEVEQLVGNESRILILGRIDEESIWPFMKNSLAFVYPSQYEGFGLPPLEALNLGANVIVGDTPVARETLQGHARYFPPSDSKRLTEMLIESISPTGHNVAAQLQYARKFTWAHAADRTLEVYRRALE